MVLIKQVIDSSSAVQDHEMLFKAYVQWFYYLIQTERTEEMAAVLQAMEGSDLSDKSKAVLLRLKGIFALMTERYTEAIMYFEASIGIFERLGDRNPYVLNIAAAHNYISEVYRRQGAFDLALEVVKRAIALCSDYNIIRGISIFNTNAGIIAYKKGDWELARDYFKKALKNFDAVDTLWRRSEAEGYLGLIEVKYGVRETGLYYLEQAKAHANAIGTPETITLIQSLDNEARNGYDYKTKL
jgi:tetratricopeptide (TPR) repeat protein